MLRSGDFLYSVELRPFEMTRLISFLSLLLLTVSCIHPSVDAYRLQRTPTLPPDPSLPTPLCPQGLKWIEDCNSCFCNPKSGLTGCTAAACPLNVTAIPFPWPEMIPKFKLPAGSPPITISNKVTRQLLSGEKPVPAPAPSVADSADADDTDFDGVDF